MQPMIASGPWEVQYVHRSADGEQSRVEVPSYKSLSRGHANVFTMRHILCEIQLADQSEAPPTARAVW